MSCIYIIFGGYLNISKKVKIQNITYQICLELLQKPTFNNLSNCKSFFLSYIYRIKYFSMRRILILISILIATYPILSIGQEKVKEQTLIQEKLHKLEEKLDPEHRLEQESELEGEPILTVDQLIQEGIELHDEGEYEEAIDRYNAALELDSTLTVAIYELSLSYLELKDFENALVYSSMVIDSDDKNLWAGAYAVKSEALTEMEKVDEAIEILYQGLEIAGEDYLLNFNLAVNFFKKGDTDSTLKYVNRAIDFDKSHSGAFLLNAYALSDKGLWVHSVLSFQMFLLLEPDSKRSKNAFAEMLQLMQITQPDKPVERSFIQQQMFRNKPINDTIKYVPPLGIEYGLNRQLVFNTITTTIDSLKATSKIAKKENENEDEKDKGAQITEEVVKTEKAVNRVEDGEIEEVDEFKIFKTVNMEVMKLLEQESKGLKDGIFWTFYIPFFSRIAHSDYYDTFSRYISVSYYPESYKWWEENPEAAINFAVWFEKGDNNS